MDGVPYLSFWGKAQPSSPNTISWHPVAYHALDVAASAHVLLETGVSKAPAVWRDERVRPALTALIALHDIGKFTRPFQFKSEANWPSLLGAMQAPYGPSHDAAGYAMLVDPLSDLLDEPLTEWLYSERMAIINALCGHHGRPADRPTDQDAALRPGVACGVCISAARTFGKDVLAMFTPPSLPRPTRAGNPELAWWLAGLTVLADWVGSSQAWFEY